MSEYNFPHIEFREPEDLYSGHWLWLWNADKIPPHIGISEDDRYYSLTYKDCEVAESATGKKMQADRAGVPLVLVKLSDSIQFGNFDAVFARYTSAIADKTTCLKPVLEVLSANEDVAQLSQLLKLLEKEKNLKEVFALHLTPDYSGIAAYSVSDILQRIGHLHETNGRKH